MDGKIVVLLRTSSVARAPAYRHLRDLGTVLVLVHPVQPAAAFDGIFHHHLLHDTDDVNALETSLAAFLKERHLKPDAIVSFDEYAVYSAAVLSQRVGRRPVPLPPAKLRDVCVKSVFREFCVARGIASPSAVVLPRPPAGADLFQHVRDLLAHAGLTFPIVLKPCPGAGSLLTKLCHSVEEVRDHVRVMWSAFASIADMRYFEAVLNSPASGGELADAEPRLVEVLAEEYIGGQEVDMDCCVENGRIVFCSISDNFEVRPPYFVEEGGLCPTTLPVEAQEALAQLLEEFIHAHGEELHGVLHFEAKYDFQRRRAFVIEVNFRLGSAETNTMVRTCYRGLQLGESLVRCALGLSVRDQLRQHYPENEQMYLNAYMDEKQRCDAMTVVTALGGAARGFFTPSSYCASVNLYPSHEGILVRADVPLDDKALVDYSVSAVPGALVAPPPKVFYLLAWMVARGDTAAAAMQAIRRITGNFVEEIATAQ